VPELPEVETIVCGLRHLVGSSIIDVERSDPRLTLDVAALAGRRIERIYRRGKFIILDLSGGRTMVVHLRMSGRLVVSCRDEDLPYVRLRLVLDRGTISFVNPRRLGTVELLPSGFSQRLGIDPMSDRFGPEALRAALATTRRPIKPALLDQRRIAGLGNIYAAEALWRARISPHRRADRLGPERLSALHRGIVEVLQEALLHMGTSFGVSVSDYRDAAGESGSFGERLAVYGREGAACPRCGAPVVRDIQSGRSTYWCSGCQL